jgi:hypothetical protein
LTIGVFVGTLCVGKAKEGPGMSNSADDNKHISWAELRNVRSLSEQQSFTEPQENKKDVWLRLSEQALKVEIDGYRLEYLREAGLLRDAAKEIEHLRRLVGEILPYLCEDVESGLWLKTDITSHIQDDCEDCLWGAESKSWEERLKSDEFVHWRALLSELEKKRNFKFLIF